MLSQERSQGHVTRPPGEHRADQDVARDEDDLAVLAGGALGADEPQVEVGGRGLHAAQAELVQDVRDGALQAVAGFGIGSLGPIVAGVTLDLGAGWVGPFVVAGVIGIATALPLAIGFRERPLVTFDHT